MAKYKLTSETKPWFGRTLYRIEALISFGSVKAGDKGGFVEVEKNLEQTGDAWVSGNAQVSGNARVYGNAQVYGDARVSPVNLIRLGGERGYPVTITDQHMQVGCEIHKIPDWFLFDERRIAAMDGARAARFWKDNRDILHAICRNERPDAFEAEKATTEAA